MASLFAYICSKNKEFENERFIYLWTAFNGMYNWISKFAKNQNSKRRVTDTEGIKTIQRYLNLGNETICEGDKTTIVNEVIHILSRYENDINGKSCIKDSKLDSEISRVLYKSKGGKYNLSSYGYLLTQFSYYYRCKMIHGNKPVLLFVHSDDVDLNSLQIVNVLLEEVITENLPFWFDDKYISEVVIPKLEKF